MNFMTFNCITRLLSSAADKSRAQTCKICKTWMRTKITSFQEIKWLESWCIKCPFNFTQIEHSVSQASQLSNTNMSTAWDDCKIKVCLGLPPKIWSHLCWSMCIIVILLQRHYTKLLLMTRGVCTVHCSHTKYVLKLPLCLYNSPHYIHTRNPPVVS